MGRFDGALTNKFIKNKTSSGDHVISIGSVECWQLKKKKGSDASVYAKLWSVSFKSQAICLHFCAKAKILAVGCDDGTIVPIDLNPKKPSNFNEQRPYQIHKGRVMGIWIDYKSKLMYSIGEDKNLYTFNLKTKNVINCKWNDIGMVGCRLRAAEI